jgi:GTP cyclohydrolase II
MKRRWVGIEPRGVPSLSTRVAFPIVSVPGAVARRDVEQLRDYGVGAQILAALGVHDMILLTNSHHTPVALGGYGLAIVGERAIPDPRA